MTTRKAGKARQTNRVGTALALAAIMSWSGAGQAATAAAVPAPWIEDAFSGSPPESYRQLSAEEMSETRGKFALVPFVGLVIGTDIALASFFWGVYLPSLQGYASCMSCVSYPTYYNGYYSGF
jgi:hypothetical protein